MRLRITAIIALGLGFASRRVAAAEPPVSICDDAGRCIRGGGMVRRAGDRAPLASARVSVVVEPSVRRPGDLPPKLHLREDQLPAEVLSTLSDDTGAWELAAMPLGRLRIIVTADGFVREERIVVVERGRALPTMFLRPVDGAAFRTVVAQQRSAPPDPVPTQRQLTQQEIATLPGTQGDPLRAIQSLPGVSRTPGGLGLIALRGAAPAQSQVFYGEHPIPRAFHMLGLSSVLQADVLESLEVQPSNFSSRWGNATGGVVLLRPRRARRDGVHGHGKVDLLSAGTHVEGKLGKGAFLVAAQRGYADVPLRIAARIAESSSFVQPRYFDYQAQLEYPTRPGELTVRVLGAGDRWQVTQPGADGKPEPGFVRGDQFHRVELVHEQRTHGWRTLVSPAFRFDVGNSKTGQGHAYRRAYVVLWRAEFEHAIGRLATLTVGTDAQFAPYQERIQVGNGFDTPIQNREARGHEGSVGVYGQLALRLGDLVLWPSVRAAAFTRYAPAPNRAGVVRGAYAIDPRLQARWQLSRRWQLRGGIGRYTQTDPLADSGSASFFTNDIPSQVVVPAAVRTVLDPQIGVGRVDPFIDSWSAVHATAGFAWTSRFGLGVEVDGFWRRLRTTSIVELFEQGDPTAPSVLQPSESITRTLGAELLVRQRIGQRLYAWMGYTLMRSVVGDTPTDFDQRHNLVLLASYALPRGFRIGGRFRVSSGSPYTPYAGVVEDGGAPRPLPGNRNSARFPAFHQLDLRLDHVWLRKRTSWTAYIDVQNVYNHTNTEALVYTADFRSVVGGFGLPVFPSLGVRFDW